MHKTYVPFTFERGSFWSTASRSTIDQNWYPYVKLITQAVIRHKKVFQRLQAKCGALRHGWQHVVHGSETRPARRPVRKMQVRIPQTRCISVDI